MSDKQMKCEYQVNEGMDRSMTDHSIRYEINYYFNNKTFNYFKLMFSTECQISNAKDSMDRFGDHLTEEVLQYLTFEDKVRLECVSKQWRRLCI